VGPWGACREVTVGVEELGGIWDPFSWSPRLGVGIIYRSLYAFNFRLW
jgi:hypothetical protein